MNPAPPISHPEGSLADLVHGSAGFGEDRALEGNETEVVSLGLSLVAQHVVEGLLDGCLLYTSDAADE